MYTDSTELLSRFHQVLVERMGPRSAGSSNASLNVGDIYYELAPFHSCRHKLGVDSIFDYERALLRMLAGEGGYLEVESLAERQKLQRQIDPRFPDPAILRDYLSVGVRICNSGPQLPEAVDEKVEQPQIRDCPSCGEPLPEQGEVQFCPFCGDDLRRTLCISCGEELRLEWRFCLACGSEVELGKGTQTTH